MEGQEAEKVDSSADSLKTPNLVSGNVEFKILNVSNEDCQYVTSKGEDCINVEEETGIKNNQNQNNECSNEELQPKSEINDVGSSKLDVDLEDSSVELTMNIPSDNSKRQNDSLTLISSLYEDSSDSGSDSRSLADGFSEHRSDCPSSNSERSDSDETEDSDSDLESIIARKPTFIPKQVKVKGELSIKDLPPIEHLQISVKEEECTPFGKVYSIVDTLLVVQSLADKPALNLDSIFFRQNGEPVGRIFDVFGPVKRPFYSIRFNTNEEIREKGLEVGLILYAAPETKHTQYVFAQQLMKEKGSDASWVNDCEPPAECIDYSDDEEERNSKRKQKKPTAIKQEEADGSPARKRYLTFEERMNRNNVMRNKYYSKVQNPTSFKRSRDVGWHNRTDNAFSSPSPRRTFTYNTNGAFQMRPPLFIPPPSTSGSSSMMRPPLPSSHYPPQKCSFHSRNLPSPPSFTPHQPPPGWPKRPQITPQHRFPLNCPPIHNTLNQSIYPQLPKNSPSDMFYQCQPPPPPSIVQSSPFLHQQYSSSSNASNTFFQFPNFPPGGNSF